MQRLDLDLRHRDQLCVHGALWEIVADQRSCPVTVSTEYIGAANHLAPQDHNFGQHCDTNDLKHCGPTQVQNI